MRTNTSAMRKASIHHPVADIKIESRSVDMKTLKRLISSALDQCLKIEKTTVSGDVIHEMMRKRHGSYYRTPGYYVRIYRNRSNLTQIKLAKKLGIEQHHLSEIEHNKRPIGKKLAKKIADVLWFDYRDLL